MPSHFPMPRFLRWVAVLVLAGLLASVPRAAAQATRVKDLTMISGARDNQLVGFGLVAGINGDGDKNQIYTVQSIANMLQRFGITVPTATPSENAISS